MVEQENDYYDNGGVGDSTLTEVAQHPDTTAAHDRVTLNLYDGRDRLIASKAGALMSGTTPNPSGETDAAHRLITYYQLDNLGEATGTYLYAADGVSLGDFASWTPTTDASDLRAQATSAYDDLGRAYRRTVFSVNPINGTVGSDLVTNDYFDAAGQLLAEGDPGGLWSKHQFDAAGRDVMDTTSDGGQLNNPQSQGTSSIVSEAAGTTYDIVLEQTLNTFNSDGGVIETLTRQRFDNDPTTSSGEGNLAGPSGGNTASRDYYTGYYRDAAGRLVASVDVGTNGGSAWTRPGTVPTGSSTVLVTGYGYAGDNVQQLTISGSPTGGTFTLSFNGQTTAAIAYNASISTVQSDLQALSSIGSGNVLVGQGISPTAGIVAGQYVIRFAGTLAGSTQPAIAANGSGLTGGTSPSASIVTTNVGGDAGYQQMVTDPRSIVSKTDVDLMGRATRSIAAFNPTINSGQPTSSDNQTTLNSYDANGDVLTTTAVQSGSSVPQTTEYVYAYTLSGGALYDNDVLRQILYPDPTTGLPSTSDPNDQTFGYNQLGDQVSAVDDHDETEHKYYFDVLGRLTADAIFYHATGIDTSVLRLGYTYNDAGLPFQQTSYSTVNGTGTPVDQDQESYNGYGQLTQEYQADSGAVNTGPLGTITPSIIYGYAQPTGANYSRLTSVTYPNGRVLDYAYNTTGIDSTISRVSALKDDAGTDAGTDQAYTYLGLSTIVQQADGNGIELSYIQQTGESNLITDGGDRYTGLDRFGRVVDQNWWNPSTSTSTDRFQYGYDPNSNVLYKANLLSSVNSELYHTSGSGNGYDDLNRLTAFERGTLGSGNTTITGTPSATNTWTMDALGNWTSTQGGSQTRGFNAQNEITSISTGTTTPTYDNAGNMTTDQNGSIYVYDAWFRLVQVKNSAGVVLASYRYDANGNRIQETHGGTTTDIYFDSAGQALEERQGSTVTAQYVWGLPYVNDLVLRDDNSTSGSIGITGSGLGRRIYVQQDANYNVTAEVSAGGTVLQRFVDDPYGTETVLNPSWGSATDAYGLAYGFQGGRLDPATGLYHFEARDYIPALGIWAEHDDPYVDGMNLYAADDSNPTSKIDPTGTQSSSASVHQIRPAADVGVPSPINPILPIARWIFGSPSTPARPQPQPAPPPPAPPSPPKPSTGPGMGVSLDCGFGLQALVPAGNGGFHLILISDSNNMLHFGWATSGTLGWGYGVTGGPSFGGTLLLGPNTLQELDGPSLGVSGTLGEGSGNINVSPGVLSGNLNVGGVGMGVYGGVTFTKTHKICDCPHVPLPTIPYLPLLGG